MTHSNHYVEVSGSAGGGYGISTRATKEAAAEFKIYLFDMIPTTTTKLAPQEEVEDDPTEIPWIPIVISLVVLLFCVLCCLYWRRACKKAPVEEVQEIHMPPAAEPKRERAPPPPADDGDSGEETDASDDYKKQPKWEISASKSGGKVRHGVTHQKTSEHMRRKSAIEDRNG